MEPDFQNVAIGAGPIRAAGLGFREIFTREDDNTMHDDPYNRWYLRLIARVFACLCGICSVRYVYVDIQHGAPHLGWVPASSQLICLGVTAAALLYLFRPRLGHHALALMTAVVLLSQGPTGTARENGFWIMIAILLVLPFLFRRSNAAR